MGAFAMTERAIRRLINAILGESSPGGDSGLLYDSVISQSGAGEPSASVGSNTIGDIVFSRVESGSYEATSTGAFPSGRTSIIIGNVLGVSVAQRVTDNVISIQTLDSSGNNQDGLLDQTAFRIVIFPES